MAGVHPSRNQKSTRIKITSVEYDGDEDCESSAVYAHTADGIFMQEIACGHHWETAMFMVQAVQARGSIELECGWKKM